MILRGFTAASRTPPWLASGSGLSIIAVGTDDQRVAGVMRVLVEAQARFTQGKAFLRLGDRDKAIAASEARRLWAS